MYVFSPLSRMQTLRTTFQWLAQRKPCSGFDRPAASVQRSRRRESKCRGPQRQAARLDTQLAKCYGADGLGQSEQGFGHNSTVHDQAAAVPDLDDKWQAFNKPIIVPTSPLAGWDELDFLENCTITVPYSTSEYGSNSSRQAASLSSSSNSSTLEAVSSTADGGAEASSGNQHSSITQSLDQDLLNEHITKAPCSGSEDLHSATAGSHSGFNSLEASEERPAAEQLLPSQLSVEESAGTETKITWCPLRCPAEVYVLLFGVGEERQGIYSLRSIDDDELPVHTVVAFASADDAFRYATLLEGVMHLSYSPHVRSMPMAALTSFCTESGYSCRLELAGSLLRPLEDSVLLTDWERGMRLRDGDFMELIEEPELMGYQEASSESAAAGPLYDSTLLGATNSSSSSSAASDINHHAREFTQWELIS